MDLILASKSPRRIALLQQFGFEFQVITADVTETIASTPEDTALDNATEKAKVVFQQYPNNLVIGADTIVVIENQILGKPHDREHAVEMLSRLSGKQHQVITGVSLLSPDLERKFYVATDVLMRPMAGYEINAYIDTDEPMGKAGAYAIQGIGGAFVESIAGCYYNVVGLPLPRLLVELKLFGFDIFARGRT